MKRQWLLMALVMLGVGLAAAQNDGVSLGEAARAQRQKKGQASPNGKVYDNENLPKSGSLSTSTGAGYGSAAESASASGAAATAAKAKNGKTPDEEAKAQENEFRQKVGEAKKKIADVEHELDIMQREARLRAAAYYGDAGAKARPENQAKYLSDEKKYQDDLKAKQDELAATKQALEDLRDQIRKAGLPSSIGE